MKVSRIIALGLLIPLCGTAVLAVYLNAQERIVPLVGKVVIPKPDAESEPEPNVVTRKSVKRATPKAVLDAEPESNSFDAAELPSNRPSPANRTQYSPSLPHPDTLQLLTQEQAADQEAQSLAAQYVQAPTEKKSAEVKKQLREKLVAIFATQQKRRTAEIAGIEARLARLKDISNKRETNKDAIVDRRLEQMTGGVDELGWEESTRGAGRYPGGEPEGYYVDPYGNGRTNTPNDYGNPVLRPEGNVPAIEPGIGEPVPTLPRSNN